MSATPQVPVGHVEAGLRLREPGLPDLPRDYVVTLHRPSNVDEREHWG